MPMLSRSHLTIAPPTATEPWNVQHTQYNSRVAKLSYHQCTSKFFSAPPFFPSPPPHFFLSFFLSPSLLSSTFLLFPFPPFPYLSRACRQGIWGSLSAPWLESVTKPQPISNLMHFSRKMWHLVPTILTVFLCGRTGDWKVPGSTLGWSTVK